MKLALINHVQISIPLGAEVAARRFYCDLLGLDEIEKPEVLKPNGGLWLQAGNLQIHLGAEDNPHRAQSRAHVAYEVDDLDAWRERLQQVGVPVKDNTQIPGYRRFDAQDPFENRLEFMERQ